MKYTPCIIFKTNEYNIIYHNVFVIVQGKLNSVKEYFKTR